MSSFGFTFNFDVSFFLYFGLFSNRISLIGSGSELFGSIWSGI